VTGGVRPEGYDGDERRNASKGGGAAMRKATNSGSVNARTVVGTKTAAASGKTAKLTVGVAVGTSSRGAPATASAPGSASSSQEMRRLVAENAELKLAVERAEQEREFYFEKLQDIEFLCQRDDFLRTHLGKVVEKILYFTEGKPDVDAIIKECADTGVGVETGEALPETADALPAVESLETAAVVEDEDEVTTPNFAEAAALGEAMASEADSLLNEQHEDEAAGDVSMTAASPLCALATAETLRTPLSPQKVNV
jgi:RP/EB family microtubule-associated protein